MKLLKNEHPDLLLLLDKDLNLSLDLDTLTSASRKSAWWVCPFSGGKYKSTIRNRIVSGDKTPFTTGKKIHPGYNDLDSQRPDVSVEWDTEANGIKASEVSARSAVRFSWVCSINAEHKWKTTVNNRTQKGSGCPYCSGQKSDTKRNLRVAHEELIEWWSPNNKKLMSEFLPGSNIDVLWHCKNCENDWTETPYLVVKRGISCVYCNNVRLKPGVNDLATMRSDLMLEWDKNKNVQAPETLMVNSREKVWWLCSESHSWQATVNSRAKGVNCHYCNNRLVLKGYNDLQSQEPGIAAEWDRQLNELSPEEVVTGYGIAHWVCKNYGHKWTATVYDRVHIGNSCPVCQNRRIAKGFNSIPVRSPQLAAEWDVEKNGISANDFTGPLSGYAWWKCEQKHSWKASILSRLSGAGCYRCKSSRKSKGEEELGDFLAEIYNGKIIDGDKSAIFPLELDYFLPDEGIAFEFNGLYWHSESAGRGKKYHVNKLTRCRDKDIQLIQIWEDDWRDRKAIVKAMVSHKLNCSNDSIYARKTKVVELSYSVAKDFCDSHHIQGVTSGSCYLGLQHDGQLVAVSVWKKGPSGDFRLERYCTSVHVIGGMGKLLKAGKAKAKEFGCNRIVTFANHEVSIGSLYAQLGFRVDAILEPDYSYLHRGERKHKFGFRLKRFQVDPELEWQDGMTERELAELNGIPKIWDSGKTRYVLDLL